MAKTNNEQSPQYWWESQLGVAEKLAQRSARLHRLVKLNAPQLIIERERLLVAEAFLQFPVDDNARREWQLAEVRGQADVDKFLADHGYFDDIIPPETKEGKPD